MLIIVFEGFLNPSHLTCHLTFHLNICLSIWFPNTQPDRENKKNTDSGGSDSNQNLSRLNGLSVF